MILLLGMLAAFAGESEPDYTVGSNSDTSHEPGCTQDYCTPANTSDNIECAALWAGDQAVFYTLNGGCTPYIFSPASCERASNGCLYQDGDSYCMYACISLSVIWTAEGPFHGMFLEGQGAIHHN